MSNTSETGKTTSLEKIGYLNSVDKRDHGYLPVYSNLFEPFRFERLCILEIGFNRGRGARMLAEYFSRSYIYCLELFKEEQQKYHDAMPVDISGRIALMQCDQSNDTELVRTLDIIRGSKHYKPFDVVIDDGSHHPDHQLSTFERVWEPLNQGGYYVIEDMHPYYANGRHATVEYFKEQLDQLNKFGDVKNKSLPPHRFEWVMFTPNRIIVRKRIQE